MACFDKHFAAVFFAAFAMFPNTELVAAFQKGHGLPAIGLKSFHLRSNGAVLMGPEQIGVCKEVGISKQV